jgi:hypothetical protein
MGGAMNKRKLVNWWVDWTDGWNHEFHGAIERKVIAGYRKAFPNAHEAFDEVDKRVKEMREFYYQRMVATSTLLIAGISVVVALLALVVAAVALIH